MEIRSRISVGGKTHYGVIASLGVALKRVAEIRVPTLRESLSVDMFTSNYLPYEASRTYRTIMTEFDCRRAQTIVEVRRHSMRGL